MSDNLSEEEVNKKADLENKEALDDSDAIEIPEEIEKLLQDLPDDKKKSIEVSIIKSLSLSYRGPLPPPSILKGYNDIVTNGAERIFIMAEEQSKHRRQLESHAITESFKQGAMGQKYAFILALVLILSSLFLGFTGHESVAITLGTTTIGSILSAFIFGKIGQKKDLSDKNN